MAHSIKVFTDRYPLLGPVIWILSIHYFIVQLLVSAAWTHVPYSWRYNTISDLGNTACGLTNGRFACSPLHALMNSSFIVLGLIMAIGSLLIFQEFRESRGTLTGFSLMALAGFGTVVVGLFPENTIGALHVLGASLPFLLGNLSLVILSIALYKIGPKARICTFISGFIPLLLLVPFLDGRYGLFGIGGMERLIAYPQTIWLILFGLYMSRNHIIYRSMWRHKQKKHR